MTKRVWKEVLDDTQWTARTMYVHASTLNEAGSRGAPSSVHCFLCGCRSPPMYLLFCKHGSIFIPFSLSFLLSPHLFSLISSRLSTAHPSPPVSLVSQGHRYGSKRKALHRWLQRRGRVCLPSEGIHSGDVVEMQRSPAKTATMTPRAL